MEERIVRAKTNDSISSITQVSPSADFDGDGFTNAQEDIAGTDPVSAASFPAIRTITKIGSIIRLQWHAIYGRRYTIEANSTLAATGWGPTSFTNVAATGTTMTADLAAPTGPQFYRLTIQHGITP